MSWCLERSSGCEQGCVTDLVLAGYKERGGRSSLPLLAGGEVISGMSPCISWNSLGFLSHPSPLRMLCSCVTWSGNFIICLGTMPHFQEGLKLNQWIRTKCKKNLVGPIFLLLEKKKSWDFFPYAQSPGAALLHSIKAVCLVLHSQWQNAPGLIPIDPDKPGACHPPRRMERAGMWHRS